jgi:hypothetical protein
MKEELKKDMEKCRKKESNRIPGNKKSLKSNKNYSGESYHNTRKTGRQNFRAQRQNRY